VKESIIGALSEFVATQLGLHYAPERWPDLQRALVAASNEWGFKEPAACAQWLMSAPLSPAQIEVLAGHLTIGETYFWREKRQFQVLEEHLFPSLIAVRREAGAKRLRVWSAGCCTGEEPYSLAILLLRLLPDPREWNITILATDLNPRFLQKAREGVYGEWSFRDAPPWLKAQYFTDAGKGRYKIALQVRQMVSFEHLNLAEDSYPSLLNNTNAMDVILCRNVLMYFNEATRQKIVEKLGHCLVEDGWLLVAPSETSQLLFSPLATVNFPGAIFYRKQPQELPKPQSKELPQWIAAPPPAPRRVSTPSRVEAPRKVNAPAPPQPAENAVRARELANQGHLEEALACCEQAIAGDKLHPGYCFLRATILQEQGDLEAAVQSLKRALYLDSDFVLVYFALGHLAQRQGREREAHKHFSNALQLAQRLPADEILPESEGITAGRIAVIIAEMTGEGVVLTREAA
jgi:chemotaxis protein methyltransferase CheR